LARLYPALRITFHSSPGSDQLERLVAQLDEFQPVAIEELPDGLRAFFGNDGSRAAALSVLAASAWMDIRLEDVPDENWAERSQAALTPVVVGRLTIAPPWAVTNEIRASAPGPIIVIQPSMGFGTGHHASTRLCLGLLQTLELDGKRVLDIGTGSGVLAIAARMLGAQHVTAIDIDPDALANARENLDLNGLDVINRVDVAEGSLATQVSAGSYDVILANLTGGLLVREAECIASLGSDGARLIVSGIQTEESENVLATIADWGWRLIDTKEEQSWVGAAFERATRNASAERSEPQSP
jgi:ribosomal protein L11 methyltransferase